VTGSLRELRLACSAIDARPLFWNEGAKRLGYEPAAAEAVAEALGLDVVWVTTGWDDRWGAVMRGDADAVWCGMAITEERARMMDFSQPYARFDESLLMRRGECVADANTTAGLRIGVPAGSTNEALARTWPGAVVVPFSGHADVFDAMIEAVVRREIDGFVDDEPALRPLAARDERFEVAFTIPTHQMWGAAMRPGSGPLRALFDRGIEHALASGTLARQWERHLPFLDFPLASTPS
jgi:polar amino acid transport system substrate-binding protein